MPSSGTKSNAEFPVMVKPAESSGEFCERVDFPKGEPENPLTESEFRDRYDALMEYAGINGEAAAKVYDFVHDHNGELNAIIGTL